MALSSLMLPADHCWLFGFVKVMAGWGYDMFPGRYSPPCCWERVCWVVTGQQPRGHPQPFQDEMLPTCEDPSAVVCPQSYVCQWSYKSHQSSMQNSTSEVITGVLPCCLPFRIIKHPVITHSEKWYTLFALLSVCVTGRCSTRQRYLLPWCGCQHKRWRFQRFWRVSWGQMSGDQLDL